MSATIAGILRGYDALVDRAIKIVSSAPYWHFVHNDEFAKLSIEGDVVTLTDFDLHCSYYDSYSVEPERVSFPVNLLLMPDSEFEAWKAEQMEIYHKEQAKRDAKAREAAAQQERFIYENLKRKFGDAP